MGDCVFCRIVANQIPASVVFEDEHTLAFMDLGQVNPGHVLVTRQTPISKIYSVWTTQWQGRFFAPRPGSHAPRVPHSPRRE